MNSASICRVTWKYDLGLTPIPGLWAWELYADNSEERCQLALEFDCMDSELYPAQQWESNRLVVADSVISRFSELDKEIGDRSTSDDGNSSTMALIGVDFTMSCLIHDCNDTSNKVQEAVHIFKTVLGSLLDEVYRRVRSA